MCGINGIFSDNPVFKKKILGQNELLSHRGPDDEGYTAINTVTGSYKSFSGNSSTPSIIEKYPSIINAGLDEYNLILGHRRLSIIDLSEGGHCPMCDSSCKIWITYNGEIYNYIELRDELISLGHRFNTASDTEVIIYSYLQWGTNCLNKFNGMWAFALWDDYSKKIFLARDRFGVKPLYYIKTEDLFAFSSEIKPLASLLNKTELNHSLIPFFVLQGNRLQNKDTYLKGINSLPPSSYMVYSGGKLDLHKYYDIKYSPAGDDRESNLCGKLEHLIQDSVKLRLRSDVPVGTCLSGGFDSSTLVSISTSLISEKIKTFSAVWSDKECDESKYIDVVNREFGCLSFKTEPRAEQFESVFNKLNYFQEIPSEGPGLIPQWYVMSLAKNQVKVLLDGQGGDEVFGGYFSHLSLLISMIKDKNIPGIAGNFRHFLKYFNKRGFHSISNWLFPRLYGKVIHLFNKENYGLLKKEIIETYGINSLIPDIEPPKKFKYYLNNLSYHFMTTVTIPTLLHYEDRSSMAFSIESRVPFLDYRIVEFGLNLAPQYLIKNGERRYLFKKALGRRIPAVVAGRKDKLGYPVPFAEWTRGKLKNYILDTLLNKNAKIYEFVDELQLKANLESHFSGKMNYSWNIWRLLSLENIMHLYGGQLSNGIKY